MICASLARACANELKVKDWLFLTPDFFINAYESTPSHTKESITIHMQFSSASTTELKSNQSWKLLCVVPQGDTALLLKVINKLIINPILDLKHSMYIYICARGGPVMCLGTARAFIGDHIGQAEIKCTHLFLCCLRMV
jgi:hypothetical protein